MTPVYVELSVRWKEMGQSNFSQQQTTTTTTTRNYPLFRTLEMISRQQSLKNDAAEHGRAASRKALHSMLAHLRSQHLNTHGLVMERMSSHYQLVKQKMWYYLQPNMSSARLEKITPSFTQVLSHLSDHLQRMITCRRLYPQQRRPSVPSCRTSLRRLGRALAILPR